MSRLAFLVATSSGMSSCGESAPPPTSDAADARRASERDQTAAAYCRSAQMAGTLAAIHLERARPGSPDAPPRACAERVSAIHQAAAAIQGFELAGSVAAVAGDVEPVLVPTTPLIEAAEAMAQGCGEAAELRLAACTTELEAAFERRNAACAARGFPPLK